MAKKAKQALPFKRRSSYLADPADLYMEEDPGKRHYDPRVHNPPNERDVRWIMKHGVQKAVLVSKEGDRVVVIDGRQRVINALEANRRLEEQGVDPIMIPVAPKRGDAVTLFQIRVICNKHRKDDDPVTEAYTMQQYLDMGHNEEDCADLWGVTKQTVKNRLYLLELAPEVQKAVVEGKITVTRALKLRNLSFEDQVEALSRKPRARKSRRPSKKKVRHVLSANGALPTPVRAAIQWANGEIDDAEATRQIKGFKKALGVS